MINFIVCDDDKRSVQNIEAIIFDMFAKQKLAFNLFKHYDYDASFFDDIIKKMENKIYILDIETPTRSGIDIARIIREDDIDSFIIFLTGYTEKYSNMILKETIMFFGYLSKNESYKENLPKILTKILKIINRKQVVRFEDGKTIYTLTLDSIIYITKDTSCRKTIIMTKTNSFAVHLTLNAIIEMLDNRFIQIHRSFFINIEKVITFDIKNNIITFGNNRVIKDCMSKEFRRELKRQKKNHQ